MLAATRGALARPSICYGAALLRHQPQLPLRQPLPCRLLNREEDATWQQRQAASDAPKECVWGVGAKVPWRLLDICSSRNLINHAAERSYEGPTAAARAGVPRCTVRFITNFQQKRVVGHRLEIVAGKHRKRRALPQKIPVHPLASAAATAAERAAPGLAVPATAQQDMSLFEVYRDLQLKWKRTTRQSRKKFNIARKWRNHYALRPAPEPRWILYLHPQMASGGRQKRRTAAASSADAGAAADDTACVASEPDVEKSSDTSELQPSPGAVGFMRMEGSYDQRPPQLSRTNPEDIFCIFKSSVSAQHKVTVGDLVQIEKLHRRQAGDRVVFGTVLLVGTKEWTILGKPTVPFAKVTAVIEQQTLTGETLSFQYKKTRRASRFLRVRHWVTMLRIEKIDVDVNLQRDEPTPPPKRLLDLWANRWLYPEELHHIKTDEEGKPLVESIYDGAEHQPGTYHRRGLAPCYRWHPDPQATHFRR